MIKILIVEDSPVYRTLLERIFSVNPEFLIIGTAKDGREAVEFVSRIKPDVITMDIHMPIMNGIEATRKIMETNPVPIVIVSSYLKDEKAENPIRAMDAGAVALMDKPGLMDDSDALVETVKLMTGVRVVTKLSRRRPEKKSRGKQASPRTVLVSRPANIELVAVGVSTGGPPVLKTIFKGLDPDFSIPIVIVQHIAAGFITGLRDWLRDISNSTISIAQHGEKLKPGIIYFAPDNCQIGVTRGCRVALDKNAPAESGLRPSVSYLFRSVTRTLGERAVGVLLTGMGRDGAKELATMKKNGALTMAQDKESSLVHGMPGEAIKLGGATLILSPAQIAAELNRLIGKQ